MKKNEKRAYVIGTTANFLKLMLAKHPAYENATCQSGFSCNFCRKCDTLNFMLSLYDSEHKHIASNWTANADEIWESACSGTINKTAEAVGLNINHYMWGSADEFLHKVRYVRVGLRDEIENVETGWFMNREHGWEVEIFTGFVKPYHSSWMSGPPEVQEEWKSGCF